VFIYSPYDEKYSIRILFRKRKQKKASFELIALVFVLGRSRVRFSALMTFILTVAFLSLTVPYLGDGPILFIFFRINYSLFFLLSYSVSSS